MPFVSLCAAAAGAGKTHKLVQVYLYYALQDPTKFAQIVAITFTNKSTQEMKERILHYLDLLAQDKDPLLSHELANRLSYHPKELQKKAVVLQRLILASYQEFAVYTIDQFFQNLIRTFAPALHLTPDYELALEETPLLQQALATLLATLPHHPALERSLIDFSLYRIQQRKPWDCTQDILNLGHVRLQQADSVSETLTFDTLEKLFGQLSQDIKQFENTLADMATQLLDLIKEKNYQASDFAWKERGIFGFLTKIKDKKCTTPSTRIRKGIEETSYWISKQSPKEPTIAPFVSSTLQPLLKKFITFYDTHHRAYATASALKSLYYALATTTRLTHLVNDFCQQENRLRMATSYALLADTLHHTPIDLLYAKLGTPYRHFLIDEFQDVSIAQWKILHPLLSHSLKQGNNSFLVGDVKQSIYRWRGGAPSLFLSQVAEDLGAHQVVQESLAYNWRSREAIIMFNNHFFVEAAKLITHYLQAKVRKEVPESQLQATLMKQVATIQQAYAHTVQKLPTKKAQAPKGYVHICAFPEKKQEDKDYTWQQAAINYTITQITHLQQAGFKLGNIAILVRNNRGANLIMEGLTAYEASQPPASRYSYQATIVGGIPLAQNPYIKLVVHAMQYIYAPMQGVDLAAFLHLYETYGNSSTTNNPSHHSLFIQVSKNKEALHRLPNDFIERLDFLRKLPLYSLVTVVIDLLKLNKPTKTPYLQAFLEVVHDFAQRPTNNLGSFLTWWQAYGTKCKLPMPENKNTITIMTIHQSKGIAFDIVFVPFCAWAFHHPPQHPPILWCHTPTAPFDQLPKAPVYFGNQLKETYYQADYYQEEQQTYLEGLNLLYVAFTRARKQLYIGTPAIHSEKLRNTAHLLQSVLKHNLADFKKCSSVQHKVEKDLIIWEIGNFDKEDSKKATHKQKVTTYAPAITTTIQHHRELLAGIVPASPEKKLGLWWHDFLAKITTKEDIAPVVNQYLARGLMTPEQAQQLLVEFNQWWSHPKLADWFAGEWHIKNETTIWQPDGTSFRPDRVMIRAKEAVVLDFKTGKKEASHTTQLAHYGRLLQAMQYEKVSGYLFYIPTQQLIKAF